MKKKIWRQRDRSKGSGKANRIRGKVIIALLLICMTVRLLPYFAPIHTADIAQQQLALEFSDRNGLPLGTLLTRDQEHTSVVPLNQVSPHFIHAILAAEDGDFYDHGALDLKAAARALKDALHTKRIVSGASTITMQLARMLDPVSRSLSGKIQEIWLSWRLVAGMNKDEILSSYINRLPMGGNIYGVEAAARTYFSIPANDLNLAQASLLAAIPNNPTYFDPLQHYERLKQRQKYVLNRMVQDGYITRSQAERAYAEEISFQSRQRGIIAAPHFLFWLASQQTTPPITPPPTPPRKQGGAKSGWNSSPIRTTIDRPLQQFVEAQVQQVLSTLAANNVHDAAALVIDNHTGEVLAYVGSPDYFNEAKQGRNDGVQALRQPGSTLKPFLYELALEKGVIRPNTILADVPAHYAIPGAKLYSPTDYTNSFLGPVRVRVALANSLNVPAVRVLEKVGVQTFLDRLHELRFEHLNQSAEYYGLGLTLGSGEVSLWELARAYLTMARLGEATSLITTFNQLEPHPPTHTPVASTGETPARRWLLSASREEGIYSPPRLRGGAGGGVTTWQLITDMLSDRHARATAFGVDSVLSLPFPAAVKTGTSSNFRDTWTVGFTTDYTVATWVGNFDGDPMRQVSGVTGAAPLWNRIMLHLHEHQEPASFPSPKGMVQLPICANSGLRPTPDCSSVVQEYFYAENLGDYERQNRFTFSGEYDEWLARQEQSSLTSISIPDRDSHIPHSRTPGVFQSQPRAEVPDKATGVSNENRNNKLKILSPHQDDVFLLYPGDEAKQRLEFKLAGTSAAPVQWWLNGEKLATSSHSVFWTLRPGTWTLEAKSGVRSDKVSFQVELASVKATRRGFSVGNP
ncbi:penicillin-binding protein 1C [Scytonema sp. HK-05]|uniref:penicillin-binding protein 1C n=1 Tax=Scytonema sp. HK-05 TaxID=1137095 RepID=UPI000AF85FAF|nr:transglycosylase domain-containing protein [Scytonema sp. HK-05]BAY48030.1 penicillin-binding protein 1C [Scytonema sp. HK-05]